MPKTPKRKRSRSSGEKRHDVAGIGLLFFAALSALGLYADAAGPAGDALVWLWRWSLGSGAFIVPFVLGWMGFIVLRRDEDRETGRALIGLAALLGMFVGFRHLSGADDSQGLRLEQLPQLGGVYGAALAWPLKRLLSVWGAGLFLACLGAIGMLVTTSTPLSRVVSWVQAGLAMFVVMTKGIAAGLFPVIHAAGTWLAEHTGPAIQAGLEKIRSLRPPPLEAGELDEPESLDAESDPDEGDEQEEPDEVRVGPADPEQQALTVPDSETAPEAAAPAPRRSYRVPPLDLLPATPEGTISRRALEETIVVLERTLRQFEVDAKVVGYTPGPTVTRFEIELGEGVKVSRVASLHNELKYALASGELRILAPIPGKSAIGIEVPNRDRLLVSLGDVIRSREAKSIKHPLAAGLGKDISGAPVVVNLADMPHLLIAGATGSGKSSCINAMVVSILARARPDQVRMILIDPKRVELSHYNGVPHLLTPVVTSPKKASEALHWVVKEMEARYEVLAEAGARNADLYNEAVRTGALSQFFEDGMPRSPFPYYLVVIDELADLMMIAPREVEDSICRIAQMARAVGIHLVVATQRPSVDVVTGVIKANIPSRLSFATASAADSRVILDEGGAERLIGLGDMLYKHASSPRPRRIQGAWVDEQAIHAITAWCRRQREAEYLEGIVSEGAAMSGDYAADEDDEELLRQALELVVRSQLGSTSMLQRKLKVGFARAGRLMDLLEQRGIVGPSLGSKPRDVLMTVEEFEEMLAGQSQS